MALELDMQKLEEILKNFYLISGLRIAIFDINGKEITAWPNNLCDFCKTLRKNQTANDICRHSDKNAFLKSSSTGSLYIYQCEFGLTEAVAPVFEEENIIGFIMIGQMIGEEAAKKTIRQRCVAYFSDIGRMEALLSEVKQYNEECIKASASLMGICASYLCLTKQIKLMRSLKSKRLIEYLQVNFRKQIKTAELCRIFDLGRTSLHLFAKQEWGMSLFDYINCLRIDEAKRLLIDTDRQIKEIAIMTGFIDQNYFSRIFKKKTGMTPTECREQMKHVEIHLK